MADDVDSHWARRLAVKIRLFVCRPCLGAAYAVIELGWRTSGNGTNAKSSNIRATAAFGTEGDINQNIPGCLQLDHPPCEHFRRSSEVS
jgi:hypothetical protein